MDTQPEPLPRELSETRRTRVAEALGPGDVMVLPAARPLLRSRDTESPYRPDSELYWLTGVTEPDAVAVLRGGEEADLVLFVRPRDPERELWAGVRPEPEAVGEAAGASEVHSADELADRLPGLLDGADTIHFRLGAHPTVEPLVLDSLRTARARGARHGTGPRGVRDPGAILDDLRLRKDPWEIDQIRRAAAITLQGFRALEAALRSGVPEWELQAALEGEFRRLGSQGPAYETIVGTGSNACTLHYVKNDRIARPGELVLVDAGASWGLYCADVTRTYPTEGLYDGPQRELAALVDTAREAAVEAVAPGVTIAEVHETAEWVLADGLRGLGILAGSVEEILEAEALTPFFPHRTSHWLGLDVHDPGDYARDGRSRVLEPGMVLTIEPGIYVGPAAMDAVGEAARAYEGLGIRLEDDVLVTDEGRENLTAGLPAEPDAVEARLEAR